MHFNRLSLYFFYIYKIIHLLKVHLTSMGIKLTFDWYTYKFQAISNEYHNSYTNFHVYHRARVYTVYTLDK